MISVLVSVAMMAAEPADLFRRGGSCPSGSCSAPASVTKEVTKEKKVEVSTCQLCGKTNCCFHKVKRFKKSCR
jgi:hypothetical protein